LICKTGTTECRSRFLSAVRPRPIRATDISRVSSRLTVNPPRDLRRGREPRKSATRRSGRNVRETSLGNQSRLIGLSGGRSAGDRPIRFRN
jgi:hypothetical protein